MKKWQIVAVIVGPSLLAWLFFGMYIAENKIEEHRESKETEARLAAMSERGEAFLEERYEEDFVCYSYNVYAPARDESIKFAVEWKMGEDRERYVSAEYYAAQIANGELSREISEELADLWGNFRAECDIAEYTYTSKKFNSNDETTIELVKNGELDWQTYMEHCGAILHNDAPGGYYQIELYILVDESSVKCTPGEEYDAILKAVEKIRGKAPGNVEFLVRVYGAPAELYGECDDYLDRHSSPYLWARFMERPARIIKADGGGHFVWMNETYASDDKAWTLDRQEYIEKRTAEFVETEKANK